MTDYAAVAARLARLDSNALATIHSAVNVSLDHDSLIGYGAETIDRIDRAITGVIEGLDAAANAERTAQVDLPSLPPADVEPLRRRMKTLQTDDEEMFERCIYTWQHSGLPVLRNEDGTPALLSEADYLKVEEHVAQHEPPASLEVRQLLTERLASLPVGAQIRYREQATRQGCNGIIVTEGRAKVMSDILDEIESTVTYEVAQRLGPVSDPLGDLISTPVANAEELAAMPPEGAGIKELREWVGGDPARARKVLDMESAKAKPRTTLVGAMAMIVGGPGGMPPVAAPHPAGSGGIKGLPGPAPIEEPAVAPAYPAADSSLLSGEAGDREDPGSLSQGVGEPSPESPQSEPSPESPARFSDADVAEALRLRSAISVMDDFRKDLAQAFRRLADVIEAS